MVTMQVPKALGLVVLCTLLLCACATKPTTQKEILDAKVVELGCAINFSALPVMRARGFLPDPDMIKGCPSRHANVTVDITPNPEKAVPTDGIGAQLYQSLLRRRMSRAIADEIATSAAFAEWERVAGAWLAVSD